MDTTALLVVDVEAVGHLVLDLAARGGPLYVLI